MRGAVQKTVQRLGRSPDLIFVDGKFVIPDVEFEQMAIIKGDRLSLNIAAASILAKVIRDRQMVVASKHFPEYGFQQHKGYGTLAHRQALKEFGPTPLHRRSSNGARRMRWRRRIGKISEVLATWIYQLKGIGSSTVTDETWAELDLVVVRKEALVIVEVRSRSSGGVDALESFDHGKRRRFIRATRLYHIHFRPNGRTFIANFSVSLG